VGTVPRMLIFLADASKCPSEMQVRRMQPCALLAKQRRRAQAMVCVTSQVSVYVAVDTSPTRAQSTVWTMRRAAAMANNVTTIGNVYA
jgi:hypothetical protein